MIEDSFRYSSGVVIPLVASFIRVCGSLGARTHTKSLISHDGSNYDRRDVEVHVYV